MPYDYETLFKQTEGCIDTWEEIYDASLSLPENVCNILKRTIFLPHDFYDIIAAYYLLPSALCRTIPYLFLCGTSGSGKSTIAKFASLLHGVNINSASDTFAGIRNSLNDRRRGVVEVPSTSEAFDTYHKEVERNTCMVWDDIDYSVFVNSPDIYRMFKFGYDKSTSRIILSSKEVGENLEFNCFCPKVFSSISPLHLSDRFKELRRRLIVIPCKRVEELSGERKAELGITDDDWQSKLLDLTAYDWKGFNLVFDEFWDTDLAVAFMTTRKLLSKSVKGLTSQQRAISLDLLACGLASGLWDDEDVAIQRVKNYWSWYKKETEQNSGLSSLLREYVKKEERNARNGGLPLAIYTAHLRCTIDNWVTSGWLYEKPKSREVKTSMFDLGLRLKQGVWAKDCETYEIK